MKLLTRLHVWSSWDGVSWNLRTQAVKTLADAVANTNKAPTLQEVSELVQQIQMTLSDPTQPGPSVTQSETTDQQITASIGSINGQNAELATVTTSVYSSNPSSTPSAPTKVMTFTEEPRLWLNSGSGWIAVDKPGALLQALESQSAGSAINFGELRDIQEQATDSGYEFTAQLNPAAAAKAMTAAVNALVSDSQKPNAASWANTILQNTKDQVDITVQPVNGVECVTSVTQNISIDIPSSLLSSLLGSGSSSGVGDMTIQETLKVQLTYNNTPIAAPSGIIL